ncbi:FHA domain-containing protein [Xanthobacter sp. TB0139]|uniref:FHA domain-containing protein n=1 Tax=Xanthobacter sp. TB0139 TaxID=3459178 RepID=UPI0040395F95
MSNLLRLNIIAPADHEGANTHSISAGPCRVGRGEDNDWVIEDPDRLMSRNHCTFDLRGGVFVVIDTSSNGLFINDKPKPLGRGNSVIVNDGDRFRLGSVTLEAKIGAEEARPDPFLSILPGGEAQGAEPAEPAEPEPFALPRADGFPTLHMDLARSDLGLPPPEDDSFLSLLPQRTTFDAELTPSEDKVESDHVPSQMQAFTPAMTTNFHIPEDWADEEPEGFDAANLFEEPAPPVPPASPAPALGAASIPGFADASEHSPAWDGLDDASVPAAPEAPSGLPFAVQLVLMETFTSLARAGAPEEAELLAGTPEEAMARLAALDPEWAGLSIRSIAACISTHLHGHQAPSSGAIRPLEFPEIPDLPEARPLPRLPDDGEDAS